MNNEEKGLRESIRSVIKFVKQKRLDEEKELRKIINTLIDYELQNLNEDQTADTDPAPNNSTGINVLEDLLKKIIPVLETDYKILTTASEQRQSFRSHVIQAIVNTLKPVEVNNEAGDGDDLNEDIEISLEDGDSDKFIDIRSDAEKKAEEEPEDPREEFGIEGEDETGRNMAYSSFKKVESNIIDAFELLGSKEDKDLFHDYLIANVKLYFDKFEDELSQTVPEPSNKAYDMAKDAEGGTLDEPTQDEIDLGL
tara:strand:- start:477 stop:1238 length:762 start_codon:yes stop_codon:yes gene_type:complete